LASGMAYELNNPLNNIGLFVGNVLHQLEEGHIDPRGCGITFKRRLSKLIRLLNSFLH
jgi:hypothetical protein